MPSMYPWIKYSASVGLWLRRSQCSICDLISSLKMVSMSGRGLVDDVDGFLLKSRNCPLVSGRGLGSRRLGGKELVKVWRSRRKGRVRPRRLLRGDTIMGFRRLWPVPIVLPEDGRLK